MAAAKNNNSVQGPQQQDPQQLTNQNGGINMGMKKYEMVKDDSITVDGHKLFRVRTTSTVGSLPVGTPGGYIESEANLSHSGSCFIYDSAKVYGGAVIKGDAVVKGISEIADSAVIDGEAVVDDSVVYDSAVIDGAANVQNSVVLDKSTITDKASVVNSQIRSNAMICDSANVVDCKVNDDATVAGTSSLWLCTVTDNVTIKDRDFSDVTIDKKMVTGFIKFKNMSLDEARIRPGILALKAQVKTKTA